MAEWMAQLARMRVPLGFVAGVVVLALARPTPMSLAVGTAVALAGEACRLWAAGHLEKSREVTRSGPYRWCRHPLYVGSSVMGIGVSIAARSAIAAALTIVYMAVSFHAAMTTEEAFLRQQFGSQYEEYCRGLAAIPDRRFSWSRAWRNREYRAFAGIAAVFAILVLKTVILPPL